MVFYWEHCLFPRGPTSHTKNHQNEFQRGRAQWELSPTTGVVQRWSLRHSSARHTLSHATSSQPTAIPTPDDTPVSRPILAVISSPKFSHFWPAFVLAIICFQVLFPSTISLSPLKESAMLNVDGGSQTEHYWQVRGPLHGLQTI